jgi:hypothetical protein
MESHEGWTTNTLYTHFSKIIEEQEKRTEQANRSSSQALEAALLAVEKATQETKHQTDKWQENSNEWRSAMTEKDRNFVTKATLWGYLLGAVGLVLAVVELMQHSGK